MPQGFQVWDASGNLIVDTNTHLGRVLGIHTVTTASGNFSHAGFSQGTPFAVAGSEAGDQSGNPWAFTPDITIVGTTLSWDFGSLPVHTTHIIYGVR